MRLRLLAIFILLWVISAFLNYKQLYTNRFVDEGEFMLTGKLASQGLKNYRDFYNPHQPLTSYISTAVHEVVGVRDLRTSLKIHRIVVLAWNVLWSFLFFLTMPVVAICTTLIWELVRFDLYGNLFLTESFSVYPLFIISALLVQGLLFARFSTKKIMALAGLSVLLFWNQQSLWPLILLALAVIKLSVYKQKQMIPIGIGWVVILASWIPFFLSLSLPDWINSIFVKNSADCAYVYGSCSFVHQLSNSLSLYRDFILQPHVFPFSLFERVLMVFFIITLVLLFRHRKYLEVGALVLATVSLALRPMVSGETLFAGFHKQTVLGFLLVITVTGTYLLRNRRLFIALVTILLLITAASRPRIFQFMPAEVSYTNNFLETEQIAAFINARSNPGDRVFAMPDDTYLYYALMPRPASYQIVYLEWMVQKESYRDGVRQLFAQSPPRFYVSNADNRVGLMEEDAGFVKLYRPTSQFRVYER